MRRCVYRKQLDLETLVCYARAELSALKTSRVLKNSFPPQFNSVRTPLDSVVFTVSARRIRLFQQPASGQNQRLVPD